MPIMHTFKHSSRKRSINLTKACQTSGIGETPYEPKISARNRTFDLVVPTSVDAWAIQTVLLWSLDELWLSPPCPFTAHRIRFTVKAEALTQGEVRWVLHELLGIEGKTPAARDVIVEAHPVAKPGTDFEMAGDKTVSCVPRTAVLDRLVAHVHRYLDYYDISALLSQVTDDDEAVKNRVECGPRPTASDGADLYLSYLNVCVACMLVSYRIDPDSTGISEAATMDVEDD